MAVQNGARKASPPGNSITDVAGVAVSSHGFTPPGMAKARLQKTATGALDDSSDSPLSNAIVLGPLWGGNSMRETELAGCSLQLAGAIGVHVLHSHTAGEVLKSGHRLRGALCRRGVTTYPVGWEILTHKRGCVAMP